MTKPITLDYTPREWQLQCHKQRRRFTVLALHRRAGKTELAIMELIDKAMKFQLELGMFVYIAPFLKQAKAIAWQRLKQKLGPLITCRLTLPWWSMPTRSPYFFGFHLANSFMRCSTWFFFQATKALSILAPLSLIAISGLVSIKAKVSSAMASWPMSLACAKRARNSASFSSQW